MPKVRDKTTLHWISNGEPLEEELYFYDESEDGSANVSIESSTASSETIEDTRVTFQPTFEQSLVILEIHECLEKLSILKCICQKNMLKSPLVFPVYKNIEERFGNQIDYGGEFLSEAKKRLMDVITLYSILHRGLEEIATRGNFGSILEGTGILKQLIDDEEELILNETECQVKESELKDRLITQAKELDTQYKDKLEELRQLEVIYEDAIGYGTLEYKYIVNWEASRKHQGKLVLERNENNYIEIMQSCEIKVKLENRIHDDIVRYFEETIDDMQTEIQYWMERYDVEVETRDADLAQLKMDREAQMETIIKMRGQYYDRTEFMKYWAVYREEKRIALELLKVQTAACIIIQAWWRGVMVRKQLGQFRKKKGKGKGKGKGKDAKGGAKKKK